MSATAQNLEALEQANRTRQVRGDIHRWLAGSTESVGRAGVAFILIDPAGPGLLATMPVGRLIGWIHRFGPARVRRLCHRAGVQETRSLCALTDRQRQALAAELSGE